MMEQSENLNKINPSIKEENEDFPIIFPERAERHLRSKPPKDAYLFFPREDECIDFDERNLKATRRRIFERKGVNNLLEYERSRLDALYKEIENVSQKTGQSIVFPEGWKETETLKFLQSTSFDINSTINLIKEHLNWRKVFWPMKVNTNIEQILNSGFIYIHGRDNHFRPIVVINAKQYLLLKEKHHTFEDITAAIIYFIEYLLRFMLIPGQVENWNIIGDLSDVKVYYLPAELMKIFKMLQSNYRARLNVVYVVGMSPFLNAIWTLVKQLIDPNTNKKIKFVKQSELDEIFEYTNKEQVEEKYGGKAKNVVPEGVAYLPEEGLYVGYFPPIMPSDNYLKDNDKRETLLISEDKYKELYLQGKLTVISPYFLEKINNVSQISPSKYDSESCYEDVRSFVPGQNNTQLDVSIYENCRELNPNRSVLNGVDTEGDFVIDPEYSVQPKKSSIQFITPNQSIKDLFQETNIKREVEGNENFHSNFNTNLYEEQIEKVKATKLITPTKNTNSAKKINTKTPNSDSPNKRNTPYTNNETYPTNRGEKEYNAFTLNDNHDQTEIDKKVKFEMGIRQNCCSTRGGKCVIF